MRIVIYSINYAPELIGIGKYNGEMAEWLSSRGHDVHVVTAQPYYPDWKVKEGYFACRYKYEKRKNVKIWRCPLWVPSRPTSVKRLLHLASFAISSLPVILLQSIWKPDIILVIEPPFFCAPQALLASRLCGAKTFLHVQDFEIDAAFSLGLLSNKSLHLIAGLLESLVIKAFNHVSAISSNMVKRLWEKGISESKTTLFPNWVDTKNIFPLKNSKKIRKHFGIPCDKIVALYSGNMGEKQGLHILIKAARRLISYPKIHFILCGEGAVLRNLKSAVANLPNLCFLPLQQMDMLNSLLNLADIHLLPQKQDLSNLIMPSKLTGMLASGRPVVSITEPGTDVAEIVRTCGIIIPPGDEKSLIDGLIRLTENPAKRHMLGKAARTFAVKNLDKEKILRKFESLLMKHIKG